MLPSTVCALKDNKNIVAIKEASGSLEQVIEIIRLCGDSISVLSGDDGIVLPILSVGGKGVISTTANVLPGEFSRICSEFEKGNIDEAARIQISVFPVYKAMFLETNPIPVKAALAMMGMISEELRLPLYTISDENRMKLQSILRAHNLIE
jgi:4-hydroxy-tetrahydrodipicolinate synthase